VCRGCARNNIGKMMNSDIHNWLLSVYGARSRRVAANEYRKDTCTVGLQKGRPELLGTPKLVIKGMCYPK
jgi:hypothetical protein